MKAIKICLLPLLLCFSVACNMRNADNPSNSAPSPESDTATEVRPDMPATTLQPDSTAMMDTMPRH